MTHRATIEIHDEAAPSLLGALKPEVIGEPDGSRSRLSLEGRMLKVEIEAEGLAPLRASVNSHLRWLHAACDSAEKARKWKDGHLP